MTDTENTAEQRLARLEMSQRTLWRVVLLFLILVAVAFGVSSWTEIEAISARLVIIPVSAVVLVCSLSAFAYRAARQALDDQHQDVEQLLPPADTDDVYGLLTTVRASRGSFRDLVDSLGAAVFSISLDGTIRAANRRFVDLLALPFQDVIGKSITQFIGSPDGDELRSALDHFLESPEWSGSVRVFITTTQKWKHFECNVYAAATGQSIQAVTIIANDVTAQRERELKFTNLFTTLHEPVFVCTHEGKFIEANPAMVRLLGCANLQQLLEKNLLGTLEAQGRELVKNAFAERRPLRDAEVALQREHGSTAICLASASFITESDGRSWYQGTLTDVTKRRESERRLWDEHALLSQILLHLPEAVLVIANDGRIDFAAGQTEEAFGSSATTLHGARFEHFLQEEDQNRWKRTVEQLTSRHSRVRVDDLTLLHDRSGEPVLARVRAVPFEDKAGWQGTILASVHVVPNVQQAQ